MPAIIVFKARIEKTAAEEATIAEDTQIERDSGARAKPADKKGSGKNLAWAVIAAAIIAGGAAYYVLRLPATPLQQAEALIKSNRPAAALPILESLAKTSPADHNYLPFLAQCYLQTDRLAEGRTALDTAIRCKLPPSSIIPVVVSFSKYYRQRSDFAEADRLLSSAQSVIPGSSFELERRELAREWAEHDAQNSRIADAITHLEASIGPDGTSDQALSHRLAELYRQQAAIEEMQNGDDKKAIALLEKSLTVSDEPASRMALANLYGKNNDTGKAIENLREVCKNDTNNLEARHRLVDLCIKSEDYKGAQEAALELSERERSIENYQTLATLYLKSENFGGAVHALEEATTLSPKDLNLFEKLHAALQTWSQVLVKNGKLDDAQSIKGRAERVAEQIKVIEKELNPDAAKTDEPKTAATEGPPLSLTASRIWLSKGSLTPEGEIKVKNSSDAPVTDLSLTVAFYDHTSKRRTGSVTVSAANESHPILAGQSRSFYFSSPNIVRAEHQLSVLIYWKGKLIRELPVVKER